MQSTAPESRINIAIIATTKNAIFVISLIIPNAMYSIIPPIINWIIPKSIKTRPFVDLKIIAIYQNYKTFADVVKVKFMII